MSIDFWNRVPFLRLVIPLILGIVCEIHQWMDISIVFPVFITGIILFTFLALFPRKISGLSVNTFNGTIGIVTMLMAGFLLSWSNRTINHDAHFSKQGMKGDLLLTGVVIDPPQEKARSVKAFIKIDGVTNGDRVNKVQGNLLVYFEKSDRSLGLRYGDRVKLKCQPQEVQPPANPEQFNFKKYLANNDIYHQSYVRNESWKMTGSGYGMPIREVAFNTRRKLLRILEKHIDREDDLAVGSALILGYKERLDPEILRSFSSAGAMHVLAVSGLHVGIIFLLLNFLLKPLDKRGRYGPWIRAGIIMLCLWGYAFITGLSPSVQRAATMFSFVIIGTATKRPTSIYNTLSASAFLLILIDPLIITKVGFQLSYLAVIGIVYLQPKIYSWMYFNNWVLDKIWAITCVSIAAQLATFPLGLYYFHQFPNYFFISNLVVIPMATLILYGGILLIIFDFIGGTALFSWVLNKFLRLLNESVLFVENIPYSLMYGNHIDVYEMLLLYLAVMLGLAWIALKRTRWFWLFAANVLLLLIISVVGRYNNASQNRMIVYRVEDKSVINFMSGNQNILISDDDFLHDESQQLYYVKHNWFARGYKEGTPVNSSDNYNAHGLLKYGGLMRFGGITVYQLADVKELNQLSENINVDHLILSGDNFFDLDAIEQKLEFDHLIIDTSVPSRTASIVEGLAKKRGWDTYNIHQRKAFIANI